MAGVGGLVNAVAPFVQPASIASGLYGATLDQPRIDAETRAYNEGLYGQINQRFFGGEDPSMKVWAEGLGIPITPEPGFEQQTMQQIGDLAASQTQGYQDFAKRASDQYGGYYGGLMNQAFNSANQNRRDFQQFYGDVVPEMRSYAGDIYNKYGQLRSDFRTGFGELQGYLEGAGSQERADIQQRFQAERGATEADLAARGLAGTTVLSGANAALTRQESDAMGGLEERLRGQRIGLGQYGLTGEAGIEQAGLGAYGGAMQNYLGTKTALGQYGVGLGAADRDRILNIMQQVGGQKTGMDIQLGQDVLNAQNYYGQLPIQYGTQLQEYGNMLLSSQQRQPGVSPWLAASQIYPSLREPPTPEQPGTDWFSPLVGGVSTLGAAAILNPAGAKELTAGLSGVGRWFG